MEWLPQPPSSSLGSAATKRIANKPRRRESTITSRAISKWASATTAESMPEPATDSRGGAGVSHTVDRPVKSERGFVVQRVAVGGVASKLTGVIATLKYEKCYTKTYARAVSASYSHFARQRRSADGGYAQKKVGRQKSFILKMSAKSSSRPCAHSSTITTTCYFETKTNVNALLHFHRLPFFVAQPRNARAQEIESDTQTHTRTSVQTRAH